ncbi:hypothetical protein [Streptacidiphilus fuscans]|uniref:Gram-positive cocci surface proteins LPxTG domain-containing protein n=1 Tax=Streptacidiphilus fuscans TaxID=2789292 RepID=A0A931BE95_9ACTN|nr:hypothetical protein [Streptacidiphilus fuscans]MBF9072593.1 hypothetical protein [Streptacidiphilus fuscans]
MLGTGTAFAWHKGDATLTEGCRPDASHVELYMHNNYTGSGPYKLTEAGSASSASSYTGVIKAKSVIEVTVPYTGPGDVWHLAIADATASLTVGDVSLCSSSTPSPKPKPKPKPTPTPKPTSTPSHTAVPTPAPTTPASPPSGGKLAETGAGDTALIGVGALAVTGLGVALLVGTRRSRRRA